MLTGAIGGAKFTIPQELRKAPLFDKVARWIPDVIPALRTPGSAEAKAALEIFIARMRGLNLRDGEPLIAQCGIAQPDAIDFAWPGVAHKTRMEYWFLVKLLFSSIVSRPDASWPMPIDGWLLPLINSIVWWESGCPVIDLTTDFFSAALLTDFGDVAQIPGLPLPSFVVRFPDSRTLQRRRSMLVYQSPYFFPQLDSKMPEPELIRVDSLTLGQFLAPSTDDTGKSGEELSSVVLGGTDQLLAPPELWSVGIQSGEATGALMGASRVLANLLLYINANGGLPPQGAKKIGSDVPVEREHAEKPRFRVGRPIKLPKQIREAAADPTGKTWKLAARFMVRGHYTHQPYGKGRLERKLIWIQPYWKGPENLAAAIQRTYEVDAEEVDLDDADPKPEVPPTTPTPEI